MPTNDKRYFLDCQSLAEMAITLVAVGVMLILPMAFMSFFLGFILGLSKYIAFFVPPGLWLMSLLAMWCRFVRIGRSWSEPKLAAREFSYLQWTSIGFVLLLSLAFPSTDTTPTINMIRWFLTALFLTVNLAYVSLAVAIRAEIPTRILSGLVLSIVVAVLTIWTK
jgi:hypothetical protein